MCSIVSISTMSTSHSKSKKKVSPFPKNSKNSNSSASVWGNIEQPPSNRAKDEKNSQTKPNTAQNRFKEIQIEHIQAAKKYTDVYESSSDEEDGLENDILDSVFKNYSGDRSQLQKTQEFLENVFQSGASTCLICIGNVKRSDYIWSCEFCFSFFHLNCLQRWAKDRISQQKINPDDVGGYYTNQGEYIPKQIKKINWCCPKCRADYAPSEIPQFYACFCKKEVNPVNHLWLVPHSCGEVCGKPLKSEYGLCSHHCTVLCHPGPCPPCSQTISISCECEKSNIRTIRCAHRSWNCGKKCAKVLACGIHVCEAVCHKECPPCMKKSQQKCICGNQIQERDCSNLKWSCGTICNKQFECGRHRCKVKCHTDDCGPCPKGVFRSCPCGKETTQAPCTIEIEPCGSTCQKTLKCGNHICTERCHRGPCGQCLEIIEKKCRCGLQSKELPCSKIFSCETKCKQLRDCNKHPCNRKCCDGDCPPCDKVCGKMLSCGKHKCSLLCHNGQCYPCNLKATVKCRCGNTTKTVPCGREKKTKIPKCNRPCKISSKCHHTNEHKCHIGECPPCLEKCLLVNDTTNCDHPCVARCHASVKVQIVDKNFKPAGPWDIQQEKYEIQKLPHPKCEIKVSVECIGGHEVALWPCHASAPNSCGRLCGRQLTCGNHTCEKICHSVENKQSMIQDKLCEECVEVCKNPRSGPGCVHLCEKRCHPKPCEPFTVGIKTACHCGLTQVYYLCSDLNRDNSDQIDEKREKLLSCGNRCINNFPCGHRCVNTCHSGNCLNAELCRKKIKVHCKCKNRKVETTCEKVREGFAVNCDESCTQRRNELKNIADQQERLKREQEDEKNRQELEEFEKKMGKKKHKERKRQIVEEKNNSQILKWTGFAVAVAALAIFAYIFLIQ